MDAGQPNPGLTKTQKTGFVLLLIFAILTIGLGTLQMRNLVYGPFVVNLAGENEVAKLFSNEETRLQSIDTDHDGLSDYEELFFYETSPYLPDTDSDGLSDKAEIDKGTDPLCPQGEDCVTMADMPAVTSTSIVSPLAQIAPTPLDVLQEAGLLDPDDNSYIDLFNSLSDPQKLRQMLLDSGQISQVELDKIDDETLLSLTNNLISENYNVNSDLADDFSSLNELNNLVQESAVSATE